VGVAVGDVALPPVVRSCRNPTNSASRMRRGHSSAMRRGRTIPAGQGRYLRKRLISLVAF